MADSLIRAYPRRCRCGSWACTGCSQRLGKRLTERLAERAELVKADGKRQILITLTVDRKQFADGALSCHEDLRKNRRVARAVQLFCEAHGQDYHGRWLSKKELHADGFPHFHVLLDVDEDLALPTKGAFDAFWPYGFSNVQHRTEAAYVAKVASYACKPATDDGVTGEEALRASMLPVKGVNWITVSRGYWARYGLAEWRDAKEAKQWDDEDTEAQPEGASWTHADRVAWCGRHSVLAIGGDVTPWLVVRLPISRKTLGMALEAEGWASEFYEDSGVVRMAEFRGLEQLQGFLERLVPTAGPPDLIAEWEEALDVVAAAVRSCSIPGPRERFPGVGRGQSSVGCCTG